jgi:hypothetical protein
MDKLMEKLLVSKKIMDKHNEIKRGDAKMDMQPDFAIPNAKYNISEELLQNNYQSNPTSIKIPSVPTIDAIKSSKLPDEIKKLMIEHPIEQPNQQQVTISNELVEKAARLMNTNQIGKNITEKNETRQIPNQSLDSSSMKSMIKEAVREVLGEYGLITESQEKTNEVFNFRLGKHIFEGKVTKIKKLK